MKKTSGSVGRDGERQRKLGELLDRGLLEALEKDKEFVAGLPPSLKAELLGKRAPKVREVDGELEAGLMSLGVLLERAGATEGGGREEQLEREVVLLREEVRVLKGRLKLMGRVHGLLARRNKDAEEIAGAVREGVRLELERVVRASELKRGWLMGDREFGELWAKVRELTGKSGGLGNEGGSQEDDGGSAGGTGAGDERDTSVSGQSGASDDGATAKGEDGGGGVVGADGELAIGDEAVEPGPDAGAG